MHRGMQNSVSGACSSTAGNPRNTKGAIALYFPQGALPHPPHPPPGQTTEGTQHSDMPGPINLITCVFSYRLRSWSSIVFNFFFFIILTS